MNWFGSHGGGNHDKKDEKMLRKYISNQRKGRTTEMPDADSVFAYISSKNRDKNLNKGARVVRKCAFDSLDKRNNRTKFNLNLSRANHIDFKPRVADKKKLEKSIFEQPLETIHEGNETPRLSSPSQSFTSPRRMHTKIPQRGKPIAITEEIFARDKKHFWDQTLPLESTELPTDDVPFYEDFNAKIAEDYQLNDDEIRNRQFEENDPTDDDYENRLFSKKVGNLTGCETTMNLTHEHPEHGNNDTCLQDTADVMDFQRKKEMDKEAFIAADQRRVNTVSGDSRTDEPMPTYSKNMMGSKLPAKSSIVAVHGTPRSNSVCEKSSSFQYGFLNLCKTAKTNADAARKEEKQKKCQFVSPIEQQKPVANASNVNAASAASNIEVRQLKMEAAKATPKKNLFQPLRPFTPMFRENKCKGETEVVTPHNKNKERFTAATRCDDNLKNGLVSDEKHLKAFATGYEVSVKPPSKVGSIERNGNQPTSTHQNSEEKTGRERKVNNPLASILQLLKERPMTKSSDHSDGKVPPRSSACKAEIAYSTSTPLVGKREQLPNISAASPLTVVGSPEAASHPIRWTEPATPMIIYERKNAKQNDYLLKPAKSDNDCNNVKQAIGSSSAQAESTPALVTSSALQSDFNTPEVPVKCSYFDKGRNNVRMHESKSTKSCQLQRPLGSLEIPKSINMLRQTSDVGCEQSPLSRGIFRNRSAGLKATVDIGVNTDVIVTCDVNTSPFRPTLRKVIGASMLSKSTISITEFPPQLVLATSLPIDDDVTEGQYGREVTADAMKAVDTPTPPSSADDVTTGSQHRAAIPDEAVFTPTPPSLSQDDDVTDGQYGKHAAATSVEVKADNTPTPPSSPILARTTRPQICEVDSEDSMTSLPGGLILRPRLKEERVEAHQHDEAVVKEVLNYIMEEVESENDSMFFSPPNYSPLNYTPSFVSL